jgi:hypothetical protein
MYPLYGCTQKNLSFSSKWIGQQTKWVGPLGVLAWLAGTHPKTTLSVLVASLEMPLKLVT